MKPERSYVSSTLRPFAVVAVTSAHAAFEKGCYYFGLESRRVPVRDDWRADVDAMAAAVDEIEVRRFDFGELLPCTHLRANVGTFDGGSQMSHPLALTQLLIAYHMVKAALGEHAV